MAARVRSTGRHHHHDGGYVLERGESQRYPELRQAADLLHLAEAPLDLLPVAEWSELQDPQPGDVTIGKPGDDAEDLVEFEDTEGFVPDH